MTKEEFAAKIKELKSKIKIIQSYETFNMLHLSEIRAYKNEISDLKALWIDHDSNKESEK